MSNSSESKENSESLENTESRENSESRTEKIDKKKPWEIIVGVAGLLSFLVALTVFFPAAKRPLYVVKSFNLINDSSSTIDNLEIKYRTCNAEKECQREDIEQLTVSRILFWNGGREKIDKTDVDDNPITIEAGVNQQNKILKAEIIETSNSKANIRLNPQTNNILFSFLDRKNTILIEVIHTGLSDEDIVLSGYVEESLFDGEMKKLELHSDGEISLVSHFGAAISIVCAAVYAALMSSLAILIMESKNYKIKIVLIFVLIPFMLIMFLSSIVNQIYFRYSSDLFKVFNSEIESVTN